MICSTMQIQSLILFFSVIILINFRDRPDTNGAFSAVVQFETESAAKTALLLTNALIVDRPITVVPYTSGFQSTHASSTPTNNTNATPQSTSENAPQPSLGTPVDHTNITQRDFQGISDEQRVSIA